jgi:exopolysaccharide biosynthesis polyprenyl glycosylphosphotransferase
MLKEHATITRRLALAIDAGLLAAAFLLAFAARFQRWPNGPWELADYGWAALVFGVLFIFGLYRAGLYLKLRYLGYREIAGRLLLSFAGSGLVTAALLFLAHATGYSRLLFLCFIMFSLVLVAASRLGNKFVLEKLRTRGYNYRAVLLAGRGPGRNRLEELFSVGNPYGVRVAGTIDLENETPDSFARHLTGAVIDEVYFALSRDQDRPELLDPFLEQAETAGKTCKILLSINEKYRNRCRFTRLAGLPLVVLRPAGPDPDQLILKRMIDIFGAGVGLLANLVLFPVIALAVKLDSPGPVFFRQLRIGRNGRPFTLYKYRSMYLDAEARKKELEEANEIAGAAFKIADDPRITRVGRFLRRTSLDEMPQFLNVLSGEMSLVGTRPPTPDEVEKYGLDHYRRLAMKPGITGLWQVSGRNRITDFDEIVRLDTHYIENWSLGLDFRILGKTLIAVWTGR